MLLTQSSNAELPARFAQALQALIEHSGTSKPKKVAIAVSGGGDSMALLDLARCWAEEHQVTLVAVTVNHGLRPEAVKEAELVAKIAGKAGIPHELLHWNGADADGNLQAQARHARYDMIAKWAAAHAVDMVLLGHTADDQAETFLMRLARGSGVDGLSQMRAIYPKQGVTWCRPMLQMTRAALRAYLASKNLPWCEDPSNEDTRFDRVKIRQAMPLLAGLGIDAQRLMQTSKAMSRARAALEDITLHHAKASVTPTEIGSVILDRDAFLNGMPEEVANRILAHSLQWVSSASYRPRFSALLDAKSAIAESKTHSLHGCLVHAKGSEVEITREPSAMPITEQLEPYDGRWKLTGPELPQMATIRALGQDGLLQCETVREQGYSRAALASSPSIWCKTDLIAAPFAGMANGWSCSLIQGHHAFFTSLVTH